MPDTLFFASLIVLVFLGGLLGLGVRLPSAFWRAFQQTSREATVVALVVLVVGALLVLAKMP